MPQHKRSDNRIGINEAAALLGVHHNTIRRYIAQGKLPAYRVGPRLIRLEVADIEALLQQVGGASS